MNLKIALLAGDGIGPEIIDQAVKVSDAVAEKFGHNITWTPGLTGAAAIDAVGEISSTSCRLTRISRESLAPSPSVTAIVTT